jgi:hypothetical protein
VFVLFCMPYSNTQLLFGGVNAGNGLRLTMTEKNGISIRNP